MQGPGRSTDHSDEGENRDPVLALKRFALVLTGDDARAEQLLAMLQSQMDLKADARVAAGALQYLQFRRLYELFQRMERGRSHSGNSLFAPNNANEAIRKGLDPQIAAVLGGLPSQHRAILLLVYGEDYSYAATAQLLGVSVEQLMSALARARLRFTDSGARPARSDIVAASANAKPELREKARPPADRRAIDDAA